MDTSTKDVAKGKLHQAKGKVKEKVGKAAGRPDWENDGRAEHDAGKVQEKIGQVERVFEK
ncbi:MAG: CsbD family protein [Terriglobia bacterium]|jgi:uncharacterized protein YjbJ (UPF0337 family)